MARQEEHYKEQINMLKQSLIGDEMSSTRWRDKGAQEIDKIVGT